jgi:Peptidase family M1 domain
VKKLSAVPVRLLLCLIAVSLTLSSAAVAQVEQPQQPAPNTTTPDTTTAPTTSHGTVLFSRDQDSAPDEKNPDQKNPDQKTQPDKKPTTPTDQPTITNAERSSLTFTAYDLDVHLVPAQAQLAVHAKLTLRNSGDKPLTKLALQLSSTLHWESFTTHSNERIARLAFVEHTIDTDADHTGQAKEAIITLPQPLAPGATIELTTLYSGEIQQSGNRLERIGAPPDQAFQADWDKIAPEGTALRGFGNVIWYPTAAAPVFLGDGAKLFQAVGQTKLQQSAATIHLRLTVEYTGDPPDAAFFCGRREPLIALSENVNELVATAPGVATADFATRPLGFRVPSLFTTDRAATPTDDNLISAVTDHYDALPIYAAASAKVQPLLKDWLGPTPLTSLNIIDQDGQPFEDDAFLIAPMRASDPAKLAPSLLHSLTHAWFNSSHVWLDEGVPQFISSLWTEQADGRDAALAQMQQQWNALALAEPALAPDANPATEGQSLILAHDEVYYRTKAAAVLWMLRSIVGDDALKHALQTYQHDAKRDEDPKEFQRVLEQSAKRDLRWFFDDWVYRDRGLPDLTIVNVTPRQLEAKGDKPVSWLISVEVRNDGDAAAEVPVIIHSGVLSSTERLRIAGRSSTSTRIVFEGTPDQVQVNDGSVPEVGATTHTKQLVAH